MTGQVGDRGRTIGGNRAGRSEPVVVATPHGLVRGLRRDGVDVHRRVPYAAPPVGRLRFAAPAPPAPWTGIRQAASASTRAIQPLPPPVRAARLVGPRGRYGENCLTVDVVAPAGSAADTAAGRPGRPVLVWVHGGAYRTGGAADYDGAPLARLGDLVVVTVNYRLGAFGFLDVADAIGLDPADSRFPGNVGVRDVLAALAWIRAAIAAFGGDPARVTVAGESAGAGLVTSLLLSPAARGLFAGVIAQSGAPTMNTEREDAAAAAREFLLALGAGPENAARVLATAPPSRVLAAMRRVNALRPDGLPFRPWFDGDLLPVSAAAARSAPTLAVPLLIGTNRDEHRLFSVLRQAVVPRTRERIAVMLVAEHGAPRASAILRSYPDDAAGLSDLGTHGVFTMPAVHLADRHSGVAPTYRYRFDFGTSRLGLGAFHAIDLMFVFDSPRVLGRALFGSPAPARDALADRVKRHWVQFVRTGSPGGDWPGGDWPRYDTPRRATRLLDVADSVADDPEGDRRRVWHGAEVPVP